MFMVIMQIIYYKEKQHGILHNFLCKYKYMSYKSIIFFIFLFGFIIFGYFCYDTFNKYFPINILIKFFIVIIGICGVFFPQIIKKLREGADNEDIKSYIIDRYKKK